MVGVDAERRSLDAVALARVLANVTHTRVLVVSVYPATELDAELAGRRYVDALREQALELARSCARSIGEAGDVHALAIADESTGRALHQLAERERASIVCVGSSRHGPLGRVLPGSAAERLLSGAPCPVAVAPRGFADDARQALGRIGCAYDERPESEAALELASSLALDAGASLELITVVEPLVISAAYAAAYAAAMERERETVLARVERRIAALPETLRADACVVAGYPRQLLEDRSRTLDLLVLGSRGYGPLRAVLAGGVSGPLLRAAACPVIVVPRGAEREPHGVAERGERVSAAN